MKTDYSKIDFHKFVDEKLAEKGFKIRLITKEMMDSRIDDFMNFVNGIRTEYKDVYGWEIESREYFLNGLVDKWKYSFTIMNNKDDLCLVNFASVYGERLHLHFLYAHKETRSLNLGKIHMIKMYQTGLDNGFTELDCYWPKNNNRSIILYMKMGWQIDSIRNNKDLFMIADTEKVRNQAFDMLLSGK